MSGSFGGTIAAAPVSPKTSTPVLPNTAFAALDHRLMLFYLVYPIPFSPSAFFFFFFLAAEQTEEKITNTLD